MKIMQKVEDISYKVLGSSIKRIEQTKAMQYLENKYSEGAYSSIVGIDKEELVLPKLNTLKAHLPGILGLWLTAFYANSIIKNKDIPKERKTPLFINNIICGVIGVISGYTITSGMNKFKQHFIPRFEEVMKKQGEEAGRIKDLKGAMSHSLIPLVAFTVGFRYLGPVVATPLANTINNFLIKHKLIQDPKAAKPKTDAGNTNPEKTNPVLEKFNNWSSNLPKLNLDTNK